MYIKTAIFPSAGTGTRLSPITKAVPKEMLPIIDKPLIHYAIEEAAEAGVEKFVIIINRNKEGIMHYFDYAADLMGLSPSQFCYVRQPYPGGLGHAIYCARKFIDNVFAVILPDDFITGGHSCLSQMISVCQESFENMCAIEHIQNPKLLLQYGVPVSLNLVSESLYAIDGVIEKPALAPSEYAIVGRYIFYPSIIDTLQKYMLQSDPNDICISSALNELSKAHKLAGFKFKGKRFDCGSKVGWLAANLYKASHIHGMMQAVNTDYLHK